MVLVFLGSCTNFVIEKSSTIQSDSYASLVSDETDAARYVKNMLLRYEMVKNSSTESKSISPDYQKDFFDTLTIVDTDGKSVVFTELSKEAQKIFIEFWAKTMIENTAKNIEQDSVFGEIVKTQNTSFSKALQATSSKNLLNITDFDLVYNEEYVKALPELNSKVESLTAKSKGFSQTKLNAFVSNFGVGYVINTINNSSTSGSSNPGGSSGSSGLNIDVGHATMIAYNGSWEARFATDRNLDICISSWGNSSSPKGVAGVQYEPLSIWIQDFQNVHLMAVGDAVWTWDWFNSRYIYSGDANLSERVSAVNYAVSQVGKPYGNVLAAKLGTDGFICSSLVWFAWRSVNQKYDIDGTPNDITVAPWDFDTTLDTRKIYIENLPVIKPFPWWK